MSTSSTPSLGFYGCVDFANNERTLAYHSWACANGLYPDGCVPVIETLCQCSDDSPVNPYTDPITDEVCWYDPAVPESSEFLGVIILKVSGAYNSTFSREVTERFNEGSILNRPKNLGRSFGFEVLMLATSCEGMNYGVEWLRKLLEETPCGNDTTCDSCFGQRLALRKFCPTGATYDDGLHQWMSTGIVDGLTEIEDAGRRECCCVLKSFTFTLQSESPYSFSCASANVCNGEADPESFVRCYDWTNDCLECEEDCCNRCGFDALCTCYPPVPIETEIIQDECFCEPLAKIIQCCCISGLPATYDTTFRIAINSGSDWSNDNYANIGLRNFTLKIFENPNNYPCITDIDSWNDWCSRANPCIELKIAYVPSNAQLVIDGRTQKISLICDGKCIPYDKVVSSTSSFSIFPLIASCRPLMICGEFDYYGSQLLPDDVGVERSSFSIETFTRYRG